ncbi:iron-sulfur cluster assembly scaffold protein [Altererythrobacter aurantiacus]|uniref:Iron-sulfur cluster assembly scaffold protein n=1 Tax=Parapontixanthobacter aurantiacus TaxID=1463599 RepID=A0A844ZEC5_9SPHN|nr:iron-sulfur cluster assembly scaffold protein [Parapontixanthobacter aurantiacus]MXO85310.1 iron-sulfur cluster assembly scaffold protein [Parapontixanthobacter aurantiacus]
MSGSPALYSPRLLGLAVTLADYPIGERMTLSESVRSRTCGSIVTVAFDPSDTSKIGISASACAVGQAAAAIFVADAEGREASSISAAMDAIASWLDDNGPLPDWADIEALAPAIPHKGRHEAILLPWKAAAVALSKGVTAG